MYWAVETSAMSKDKEKSDVLSEILDCRTDPTEHMESVEPVEGLDELIHRSFRVPGRPLVRLPRHKEAKSARRRGAKKKSTLYLTEEVFRELELAKTTIRAMIPRNTKHQASKSNIVDIALRIVLKEFEKRGDESLLMKQLARLAGRQTK